MQIQILGLREYVDHKDNKSKKVEKFFENLWRAPSVAEILANPDEYLKQVPAEERFNLYFTVAECLEGKGRKLQAQKVIPFDIDGIDRTKIRETWFAACEALGITPEKNGATFSGNGIWLFVKAHEDITDDSYFEANRTYYKEVCAKITQALKRKGLEGFADPSVWSTARIARMPNTMNIKKNKEDVMAYTLNPLIMDEGFNFITKSGIPILGKEDQLSPTFMRGFPSPDANEILSERGCGFIASCKKTPDKVSEEAWYAMLGILEWLPEGRTLSHEYSRGHSGYSASETDHKADQAKQNAGPRTCKNINQIWGKCGACKHFNKITSPVQIVGAEFIKTEKTGFWSYKQNKEGDTVPNKPEVMDLVKYFKRKHEFVSVPENGELFLYNGKHWEEKHTSYLSIYAKEHFHPYVPTYLYDEFKKNVLLSNVVQRDWFHRSTAGKFNMRNGVYDMHTGEVSSHSRDLGFTHILPYDYDKDAACPAFDKFLDEVTVKREDLKSVLLEFSGYCISNDESWLQKAIFLNGDGANGKSIFADVLRSVAGANNVSSQRLERLGMPVVNALLENKLVNISEEAGKSAFFASDDFKEIVTGGHMTIKKLYKNQYEIQNRTKFVMLCNGLPLAADGSHGFFRRLIIVPFDATFDEATRDPFILSKLIVECAGIFNLLVKHYKILKDRGTINKSATVTKSMGHYAYESDIALEWVRETFTMDNDAPIEKHAITTDVYQEYAQNCMYEWGIKPVSSIAFWKKAEKAFKDKDFHSKRKQIRRNGKTVWIVRGLVRKEILNDEF